MKCIMSTTLGIRLAMQTNCLCTKADNIKIGGASMFWLLLYAIIMAAAFSFCYICHKRLHQNEHSYDDGDSLFFAVTLALFWPVTVWFFGPYLFINLYKYK